MMCLQTRLTPRMVARAVIAVLAASAAACSAAQAGDVPNVDVSQQALDLGPLRPLAAACGLACPGDKDDEGYEIKGIADGNAAISGVASIDAFFSSVVHFKGAATGVAGGIKTQLDLIKGDFGIAASADLATELEAKFKANLDGTVEFKADPARCQADISATLKAKARCEGEVNPPKVAIMCKGGCEVDASVEAMCGADADVECTFVPPNLMCSGSCSGSCEVKAMVAAACSGTCRGMCSGDCSAYVKKDGAAAECAGSCDGMCTGSCETDISGGATCMGSCKGECTVKSPMGGCKAAIRAECTGKANASIMCDGKCTGDVEPASAKVECQASAKAEAKINVQCTPPRVTLAYKLRVAAGAELQVRAKFEAALKTLVNVRLPALKAEIARGKSVSEAGAGLVSAAGGALKGAFDASGDANLRVKVGVLCAVDQLDDVKGVIDASTGTLKTQLDAAAKVTGMLKV